MIPEHLKGWDVESFDVSLAFKAGDQMLQHQEMSAELAQRGYEHYVLTETLKDRERKPVARRIWYIHKDEYQKFLTTR